MKTFLKILALFVLVALLVHVWPVAAVPLVLGGIIALVIAGVLTGGLVLAAVITLSLILAVGGAAVGLLTALSPIWLPILLLVGLICLLRRSPHRHA